MQTPVTIYVVHHPQCRQAEMLAGRLFDWFRLVYLSGNSSAAGLPVYFRRQLSGSTLQPQIRFDEAELNVVIVLVDHNLVGDALWRKAIVGLAGEVGQWRNDKNAKSQAILLPGAMHDSFYRTGSLYERFNPIRLIDLDDEKMEAAIRRATTEATARMLRARDSKDPPPLNVFLSHAKRDGREIAESIRDGVRSFSQLVAWYDANDLPFGTAWESPMEQAAKQGTAAMVVVVTDAYPTRPWCRREAWLARRPAQLTEPKGSRVWRVQPVVAVHQPGSGWTRGVPMLSGVPRIGWDDYSRVDLTERVVDRLVLEVMLGRVHEKVAMELDKADRNRDRDAPRWRSCFITWVPDAWTLSSLRHQLGRRASSVRRIVYPGYGLTNVETAELRSVVTLFHRDTKLVSFEEAWQ